MLSWSRFFSMNISSESVSEYLYHHFGATGKHGAYMPYLMLKGASQLVPQLNLFIDKLYPNSADKMLILDLEMGKSYFNALEYNEEVKKFGEILYRHGSDKSHHSCNFQHVYVGIIHTLGGPLVPIRTLEICKRFNIFYLLMNSTIRYGNQ